MTGEEQCTSEPANERRVNAADHRMDGYVWSRALCVAGSATKHMLATGFETLTSMVYLHCHHRFASKGPWRRVLQVVVAVVIPRTSWK
jgi:hypothetical protein